MLNKLPDQCATNEYHNSHSKCHPYRLDYRLLLNLDYRLSFRLADKYL